MKDIKELTVRSQTLEMKAKFDKVGAMQILAELLPNLQQIPVKGENKAGYKILSDLTLIVPYGKIFLWKTDYLVAEFVEV